MSESTDLERAVTDLLADLAASASPPDDAWDRIAAELSDAPRTSVAGNVAETEILNVHETLTGDHRPAGSRQPRPVLIAAAVAAVVAMTFGLVLALTGDSSVETISSDELQQPPPPEPDPVPPLEESGPPPISVDALGYRWSRLADDEGIFADKVPFTRGMSDVAVGGPGLVAVGEGDDGIAVWTSVDGITWSRVPHDEAVFGGEGEQTMSSVTAGGPGLVAVGGSGDFVEEDGDAAVWTSVDGLSWLRVPHDEAVLGGPGIQQMVSVTTGGPGLVAVGWDGSGDAPDAAVWTSVDGVSWSRVSHDETVFGGEGEQTMSSVTEGGPGLVAVGSAGFEDGVDRGQLSNWKTDFLGDAAVWISADGIIWSRVPHDETVFGGEGNQWMNAVTVAGPGLVAVGGDWLTEGIGAAAVWTSADGIIWSRVPHDETVFGGENDQEMNSVTSTGPGLVAVGRAWARSGGDHSAGSDDSAASVWTSADGTNWSWVGYNEAVFGSLDNSSYLLSDGPVFTEYRQAMHSVLATDVGLVAVGEDWSGPSHGAAVWVGTAGD